MTREEAFEKMLADVQANHAAVTAKMDKLKIEGKTKTVTYRELMGNKLMLQHILTLYRGYGLIGEDEG